MYDHLKDRGPTSVSDPELLSAASELPSYCQELIAQYGSLEGFLTRSVARPRSHGQTRPPSRGWQPRASGYRHTVERNLGLAGDVDSQWFMQRLTCYVITHN